MNFKKLHYQDDALLIANVWDVASAKVAKKLGFKAIGTSSSAIAKVLGHMDGEKINFTNLLFFVRHITKHSSLPLTVDIEAGYSRNPLKIAEHIRQLAELGVVGVNIEDSLVTNVRTLLTPQDFAQTLQSVTKQLARNNVEIFINIRTDTFLLAQPTDDMIIVMTDTKERIKLYENAGANGIFIPCIEQVEHIQDLVKCTDLPLNVMCMPQLPNFKKLTELGVQRISMGDFLFDKMYLDFEHNMTDILHNQTFDLVF